MSIVNYHYITPNGQVVVIDKTKRGNYAAYLKSEYTNKEKPSRFHAVPSNKDVVLVMETLESFASAHAWKKVVESSDVSASTEEEPIQEEIKPVAQKIYCFMMSEDKAMAVGQDGTIYHKFDGKTKDQVQEEWFKAIDVPEGCEKVWVDNPDSHAELADAIMNISSDGVQEGSQDATQTEEAPPQGEPVSQPEVQKKADGSYDTIDVPVVPSDSEANLRDKIMDLQRVEMERNAANADYNQQIKDIKKVIFDMVNRKPMKPVRCIIRYRWDKGVKEWCEDGNETNVLHSAPIPNEEHQTALPLETCDNNDTNITDETTETVPELENEEAETETAEKEEIE